MGNGIGITMGSCHHVCYLRTQSSKLLRLADEYTVANGLEDVARLVEVLARSSSLHQLSGSYKQIQRTSDWLLSVADFMNTLNGTLGSQVMG